MNEILDGFFIDGDRIRLEIIPPDPVPVKPAGIRDKFGMKPALSEFPEQLLIFRIETEYQRVDQLEKGSLMLARLRRIADMRRMVNHFPQKISAKFLIIAGEHQGFMPDVIYGRAVHAHVVQINIECQETLEFQ